MYHDPAQRTRSNHGKKKEGISREPSGCYYRYSGGSQQTEQSIEGQRRDCEAYARQHGLTIVHEYIDRHISAVVLNPGWLFSR